MCIKYRNCYNIYGGHIVINETLLFADNPMVSNSKIRVKNCKIILAFKKKIIDGKAILLLIKLINDIQNTYHNVKMPLIIELGNVIFADKLTIIIFECICHYLITCCGRCVYLQYSINTNDIWTEGVMSSPLLILGTPDQYHIEKFNKKYIFDLYRSHFRRVVQPAKNDSLALSRLMTEVEFFLKGFSVKDDCRDKISEVIVELIGNAGDHTNTECLVDIDITFPYTIKGTENEVYGVNIVVANFSDRLFGSALKEKLKSLGDRKIPNDSRYHAVLEAYTNHRLQFSDKYLEEDFFNIASFQHKISGRNESLLVGGTGLTKLIKTLEKMSDAHKCYMLTGNRVVNFFHEHLEYDTNNWISFNGTKDFVTTIPAEGVLGECPIYFPGTAYNLNFVMRKEH